MSPYSTKPTKGKTVGKSKLASSSRLQDEDVEMIDAGFTKNEGGEIEPHIQEHMGDGVQKPECDIPHDDLGNADDNHLDDEDDDDEEAGGEGNDSGDGGGNPSGPGGSLNDFDAAMAFLGGGDIRQFGSYMVSVTSRLKNMLSNIKATADPTTRMLTLQELSELLSISTEDTLAGSFPVEQYVRELVRILGGKGAEDDDDDEDRDEDQEQDEDAQLAVALAMSSGGAFQGDENLEAQVLACRCLANLMEALPGVAHTVVYHGAIPVLCSKLIEISYIDLAEQTLSVCFISSFVLILLMYYSPLDYGEDFRRISLFYRSRRWPRCLAQLSGFLLYCCTEDCSTGCGELLSECIPRTLPHGQECLADHPQLSVVL
jgi:E3 ubiquitin-protein ligase TRIP12